MIDTGRCLIYRYVCRCVYYHLLLHKHQEEKKKEKVHRTF